MKIKAEKLVEMWNVLNKLGEKETSLSLAVAIADNIDSLSKPVEIITKRERELIDKYGDKDEKGNIRSEDGVGFRIKNATEFLSERAKIFTSEVDVRVNLIPEDELEGMTISAKDYLALKPILKRKVKNDEPNKKK